MRMNVGDAKSLGFDLIPQGKYDFMVTGAEEKLSKAGNQYISLENSVMNDDEEGIFNRKVWTNINNNEIGAGILKKILEVNNHPLAKTSGETEIPTEALVGLKFSAKVIHKKGQDDELRAELRGFDEVNEEFSEATLSMFKKTGGLPTAGGTSAFEAPEDTPF